MRIQNSMYALSSSRVIGVHLSNRSCRLAYLIHYPMQKILGEKEIEYVNQGLGDW